MNAASKGRHMRKYVLGRFDYERIVIARIKPSNIRRSTPAESGND